MDLNKQAFLFRLIIFILHFIIAFLFICDKVFPMKLLYTYLSNPAGPLIRIEINVAQDGSAKLFDITWGHGKAMPVAISSLPSYVQIAIAKVIAGIRPVPCYLEILEE